VLALKWKAASSDRAACSTEIFAPDVDGKACLIEKVGGQA